MSEDRGAESTEPKFLLRVPCSLLPAHKSRVQVVKAVVKLWSIATRDSNPADLRSAGRSRVLPSDHFLWHIVCKLSALGTQLIGSCISRFYCRTTGRLMFQRVRASHRRLASSEGRTRLARIVCTVGPRALWPRQWPGSSNAAWESRQIGGNGLTVRC